MGDGSNKAKKGCDGRGEDVGPQPQMEIGIEGVRRCSMLTEMMNAGNNTGDRA